MRIGDLAAGAGVTAKTIRFYEQAGLLPDPPRTSAGYRDYPPAARERLAFIRDAQTAGLTLAEIRGVLAIRDAGQPPCRHVSTLIETHLEQVEQRIAELLATRTALQGLHQRARDVDPAECGPEGICRILTTPA
ncbi:heavy metal-responsive transcriptional regulator [Nonomuraea sp. NPDC003707]